MQLYEIIQKSELMSLLAVFSYVIANIKIRIEFCDEDYNSIIKFLTRIEQKACHSCESRNPLLPEARHLFSAFLTLDNQVSDPDRTKKPVIPAKAGIRFPQILRIRRQWIPAFAGMTEKT
ncbi:Uncharacterized protein dnm_053530 [Desulfonema magnum]|uniref:Uncharacterized protein n=1 Tax=Desulfonema magnum TaxID=45655 RepID=A0A975BPK7_9BACT|nr:Uncharacterized protein dnm_053530 [Desulfonema magnum]